MQIFHSREEGRGGGGGRSETEERNRENANLLNKLLFMFFFLFHSIFFFNSLNCSPLLFWLLCNYYYFCCYFSPFLYNIPVHDIFHFYHHQHHVSLFVCLHKVQKLLSPISISTSQTTTTEQKCFKVSLLFADQKEIKNYYFSLQHVLFTYMLLVCHRFKNNICKYYINMVILNAASQKNFFALIYFMHAIIIVFLIFIAYYGFACIIKTTNIRQHDIQ